MKGRMGIVSGRYRSSQTSINGRSQPQTVIELFGRTDTGSSVCLLVHGLRPSFEIAPIGTWDLDDGMPSFIKDRIENVRSMEHVLAVSGPETKWTPVSYTHLTLPTKA